MRVAQQAMMLALSGPNLWSKNVEMCTMFEWASPPDVLTALKTYCSSFYGSMLWDLDGFKASEVFTF